MVGYLRGGTVARCHVTSTVFIRANDQGGDYYHGGVVGSSGSGTVVEDCTSAATVTGNTNSELFLYYGGIAGVNYGTVRRCLADGVSVPVITSGYGNSYGAVVGMNKNNGTASGNYYHNCTAGTATTGIGVCGADQSGQAEPVYALSGIPTAATVSPAATFTYGGTSYYTANTEITITSPDASTIFSTFAATGATASSLATDKLSATITLGTATVCWAPPRSPSSASPSCSCGSSAAAPSGPTPCCSACSWRSSSPCSTPSRLTATAMTTTTDSRPR